MQIQISWLLGFVRSQLIWIYSVCIGRAYPGSVGSWLTYVYSILQQNHCTTFSLITNHHSDSSLFPTDCPSQVITQVSCTFCLRLLRHSFRKLCRSDLPDIIIESGLDRRKIYLCQHLRKGYLSHTQPAKTQVRLHISAVSPEPLLFADI